MKPILVIDDDCDVREVIVFALENDGFQVLSADNGVTALNTLMKLGPAEYPGLIIVDYLMPEMDGITFIKKIKEDFPDSLAKIPMVFSSAMGSTDVKDPTLDGVVTLYKPMDLDDLLKVVHSHCS